MKKLTVMLLITAMVLGLTACGGASDKGTTVTETQTQSTESADDINARIKELSDKENAIISEHQDLWDTVFNSIDKKEAENSTEQNYGAFLESQLDKIKDQFSDEDLDKLNKDIEEIKKIEDQMEKLTAQIGTENSEEGE